MNRKLHCERADYGASAGKMADQVVQLAKDSGLKVILDFGCGKGTLKPAIKVLAPSLRVLEYDPAIAHKDRLPTRQPDLIVALDVMEHIEPEYLDKVLETMRDLRPKAVMMLIALTLANKTLPDGRNAHLIVEGADWWLARLGLYFRPLQADRHPSHLRYIGSPL